MVFFPKKSSGWQMDPTDYSCKTHAIRPYTSKELGVSGQSGLVCTTGRLPYSTKQTSCGSGSGRTASTTDWSARDSKHNAETIPPRPNRRSKSDHVEGCAYLTVLNRFSIAAQFTTFHQAAIYSARRLWYLR